MSQWVPLKDAEALLGKSYRQLLRLTQAGDFRSKIEKINGRDTTLIWIDGTVTAKHQPSIVDGPNKAHGSYMKEWKYAARNGLLHKNEEYSDTTVYNYETRLKRFFGRYSVINQATLLGAFETLCGKARDSGESDDKKSADAKMAMYRAVMCYAQYLHKFQPELMPSETVAVLKLIKPPRKRLRKRDVVYYDDLLTILQHITGHRYYLDNDKTLNKALVTTLWFTGARSDEACNLRLEDLDFTGRTQNGTPNIFIREGKGCKQRHVPMPPVLIEVLKDYLTVRVGSQAPDAQVFVDNRTKVPLYPTTVWYRMSRIHEQTSIKCNPHAFRRGYASFLSDQGVAVDHIKELLGHADIETTELYVNSRKKTVLNNALNALRGIQFG